MYVCIYIYWSIIILQYYYNTGVRYCLSLSEREREYALQYSCPKNPMDRGVWQPAVQRVSEESDTIEQLSAHAHIHTHRV